MPLGSYSTATAKRQSGPLDDLPQAPTLRGPGTPQAQSPQNERRHWKSRSGHLFSSGTPTNLGQPSTQRTSGTKFTLFSPSGKPAR
jgi:hypothetical protein